MHGKCLVFAIVTTIAIGCPWAVRAADESSRTQIASTPEEWKLLTNDQSRADLFEFVIEAKRKDLKEEADKFLPGPFVFPRHTRFDDVLNKPRTNVIFGLDISHHNGVGPQFDLLRQQNIRFVYAKATQGVGFKDGRFAEYWAALAALPTDKRVLRGAYHFLSSDTGGVAQANSFLRLLDQNGGLLAGDLPPVADLEWDIATKDGPDRWQRRSPDEIIAVLLDWLKTVEAKTHKTPMIYTARSWWQQRIGSEAKFATLAPYRIWIADYSRSSRGNETPAVPNNAAWHLWQFTEQSQVSEGYGRKLDANIYKGTDDQFMRDFQLTNR